MEAIFLRILNMSISAGWLIAFVFVLRLLFEKLPKSFNYILWTLVAIRLICPFTIESVLSLVPSSEVVPKEIMYSRTPEVETGIDAVDTVLNPVITGSMAPVEIGPSVNPMQVVTYVASTLWIIGIIAMLLYMGISYLMLRRKVRASVHMQENVWICDEIDSPFILGIIRPRIYLHSDIEEGQIPYIVAHEKEHLKYRDYLWKPLGFLILAIHWFNPLVWLSYICMCRDMELACDERVIRSMDVDEKKMYSNVLLACSAKRRVISACPVAFGEVGIKQRIKSVVNYKKPAFWILCVAVVVCLVVGVCFFTNPKGEAISLNDGKENIFPGDAQIDYLYQTEDPLCLSRITLDILRKQFTFWVSPLSSALPHTGEYVIAEDELRLMASGTSVFVFKIKDDTLVFDATKSSDVPRYQYFPEGISSFYYSVPDGAVFEYEGDIKTLACNYLTELFTSNTERYQEYLQASGGVYSPINVDTDFMEKSYAQKYVGLYREYCTSNCLTMLEDAGLYTFVDYLAYNAGSQVTVKRIDVTPVKPEKPDIKSSSILGTYVEYYCVIHLINTKGKTNTEFSVQAQVSLMDTDIYRSNGWKVYSTILNDYQASSQYITGENIFTSNGGGTHITQKSVTETSILTSSEESVIQIQAKQIINGKEYECGIRFPKKFTEEDKREELTIEHIEFYENTENARMLNGYINWESKDVLYVWITMMDEEAYTLNGDSDISSHDITFRVRNWDNF